MSPESAWVWVHPQTKRPDTYKDQGAEAEENEVLRRSSTRSLAHDPIKLQMAWVRGDRTPQ